MTASRIYLLLAALVLAPLANGQLLINVYGGAGGTVVTSPFNADNIFGNFTNATAIPGTQTIPTCANNGTNALVYDTHTLTCEAITAGDVSGTGTPGKIAAFVTNTKTLTNSALTEASGALTIAEPTTIGSTGQSTFTLYDTSGVAVVPVAGQGIFCATVVNTNDCQVQWGPTAGKIVGTGGTLTSNAVVIGSGSQSVATATNATMSAGALTLGNAGTATGSVVLNGTTSGSMTVTVNPTGTALLLGSNFNWVDASGAAQLGADGSIGGSVQLSNSAAAFHNVITAGATANNTLKLPATVIATNHIPYCVTTSTSCQLTDFAPITPQPAGLAGAVTTLTAAITGVNTTETTLLSYTVPANTISAGTTFSIDLYGECTSSVANVSDFQIYMGTVGDNTDTKILDYAVTAAATGTSIPFHATFMVTFRTTSTTGVQGAITTGGTNNGIQATSVSGATVTSTSSVPTTGADILHISYKSAGATTTSAFRVGAITLLKP